MQRWVEQDEQPGRSDSVFALGIPLPLVWHPPAAVSLGDLSLMDLCCLGKIPDMTFSNGQPLGLPATCCPAELFHTPDFWRGTASVNQVLPRY